MRFLVLAYSYPPINNPRAIRWNAIAEHWAAQGHDVDVVCGWRPGMSREETRGRIQVHRVGGNLSERIRAVLCPGTVASSTGQSVETVGRPQRWKCLLKRLVRACHDATWKKLYWPDSNCLWYLPAVKTARRLLALHRYDAVYSVSIPFTSHMVANRLRNQFGDAPWLVDIGDPFSFLDQCPPNNRALYRGTNTVWEHRILQAATAVSVTSQETAARYRDLFADCAAKIHVIPPLATQARRAAKRGAGPLKLVYTGTLYRNIRNPTFLFELFGDLLQNTPRRGLELHLYGLVNDCGDIVSTYQQKLGAALHVHGVVAPEAAKQAVAEADVLVNLGNSTSYQLPSKIVDYAATGKPLLNLITIDDDSSAAVLEFHPSTLTVHQRAYAHDLQTTRDVAGFIDSPPQVAGDELDQWLSPFTIENVAAKYCELAVGTPAASVPAAVLPKAA